MELPIVDLSLKTTNNFSNRKNKITSTKYHIEGALIYYDCDRSLNTSCCRVISGIPCGSCKGTTNINFARMYYE